MQTVIMEIELEQLDHDCGPDCFCWLNENEHANSAPVPATRKRARGRAGSDEVIRLPKFS